MGSIDLEQLKKDIVSALGDAFPGIWKDDDTDFLTELAENIAVQKFKSLIASTPEKKVEHDANIQHLLATGVSRACQKGLVLEGQAVQVVIRILEMVVSMLLKAAIASAISI